MADYGYPDGGGEEKDMQWPPAPPAYGYPDDDGGGKRPPFVLIDPKAYFADRKNATTAFCDMKAPKLKGRLQVTFCAVAPPLVSYFCVHATHMDHTEFAVSPFIVATETDGGLVLLCVVAGKHPTDAQLLRNRQYFVYDACDCQLYHLPHPGPQHEINGFSLAIMREPNKGTGTCNLHPHGQAEFGHFVVAAQARFFWGKESPQLCIYHSATKTWSKKPVVIDSSPQKHSTTKTFTIGGPKGTVAWVDLCRNIIFCDVLAERPKLSCLNLPPPLRPRPNVGAGDPRSHRNIAVLGNTIKYVEMLPHPDRSSSTHPSHRWEVAAWSIQKANRSWPKDWHTECNLDSTHIRVDSGTTAAALPTLSTLHVGLPTVSLQNDAIIYLLAKIDYRQSEHTAWVLAVDMQTKTVTQVAEFCAERTLGLALGFDASSISAYLQTAPGTQRIPKRPGVPLMKCPSKKQSKDA
ncbi:hypothetical protein CFC21_053782 [Triticum aestivum]|uniref:DUF1618 domain-containing protein n=2 Tax=Triticum aestivum TaxID=4565 RepID=A0A9R1K897_WHEAT|nr:uncharacterized protein LOC119289292 [Triticum dicoccoides]XP_044360741.1 uncharacterized protein LOC123082477 [Triticum aestivum]KAF7044574.1 hypothetical protein CFC21_053782 [Triticum aestivum]